MLYEHQNWNQAEFSDPAQIDAVKKGIITLVAFHDSGRPELIGGGFITGGDGNRAIVTTASHVLEDLIRIQKPYKKYHSSALPDFIPDSATEISIAQDRIRAIAHLRNGKVDMCMLDWAIRDEYTDIGNLQICPQKVDQYSESNPAFSQSFGIGVNHNLEEGSLVSLIGNAYINIDEYEVAEDGVEKIAISKRFIMRCGRVKSVHPDGILQCKGPCITTTIPIHNGLSGSPIFIYGTEGPMIAIGVASHGPSLSDQQFNDFTSDGDSVFSIFRGDILLGSKGAPKGKLKLVKPRLTRAS